AASASRSGSSKQLISALLGGSRGEEGPWGLEASGAWSGGGAAGSGGSVDGDGEEGERVGWNGAIEMTLTGDQQRESFVQEMLSTLAGTLKKAFCARGSRGERAKKTPPPPLPLAPLPERQEEREEPEDESLKKQEEHYLRELRICLREVLGELRKDRRFSMFKQIGDYEGEFMDLNGIRDKLNAEEYVTLDDFEEDLKLMAEEAKEVRDRLKANLARAETNASALEGARGAAAGEVVGGGAPGGAGRGSGGGDDVGLRRALMEVDRATNQLARAATAVDMACFLRDAALSFLQDCVSRLGYDLEGKCKDIAARKKARGNGGGGGRAGGRSSPTSGKRSPTAAATGGRGDGDGGGSRSAVAPNYTSESVIEDIYGGVAAQQTGTGSRDRATRASRRSASSDGRFVQLGDRGKLLEQGTEVEVVPPPAKRAARQQRSPAKRRVMFDKGGGEEGGEQEGHEKEAPPTAPAVTVSTAEEQGKLGEGEVRGQASSAQGATTSAPATVEPPLAASVVDSGSVSEGSCTTPGSNAAVVAAPAPAASKDATVAAAPAAPAPTAVATTLPALDTAHGGDEEQQNGGGQAVSSATNPAAPAEEEEEPRPALVVPSPEAAATGSAANVNLGAASIPSGAAPSVAADAAAGGAGLEQRRQEDPAQPVTAAKESFPLGVAADGDGDALMKDAPAAAAAAAVDAGPPTQSRQTSASTSLGGLAGGDGGCDGGVATAPAAAATAAMTAAAATATVAVDPPAVLSSSSSSNGAPSAADKAQTEALAAEEGVKAA
ncbi:unnamed protein product, partial [Ectocarpus sp. 12 AP-2014]